MNRWKIPNWLEEEVRLRDTICIYCHVEMLPSGTLHSDRRRTATWEHIINDASIVTRENIALCCRACNASKGTKELAVWLESNYCKQNRIHKNNIAPIARSLLEDSEVR